MNNEMLEKKKYEYAIVVLVYKNVNDLQEMIESVEKKISSYRILVVNAFFDIKTEREIKKVAMEHACDFLSVENKGYGYGNNRGIKYMSENYIFKYLILSNPDIVIKEFPKSTIDFVGDIIAPKIISASGKLQNPMLPVENNISEWLIYRGFKSNKKLMTYFGIGINKLLRAFFMIRYNKKKQIAIYAAHGSFVIFSSEAIKKMGKSIYDENMFLFAEESVLARKAKQYGFITIYDSEIVINHKEDGSMKLSNFSVNNELIKSNIYYYEHYVKEVEL